MIEIEKVINSCKQQNKPNTTTQQQIIQSREDTLTNLTLTGLPSQNQSLGNRAFCIHKFLIAEMRLAELFSVLNLAFFKPLTDASKGAFT